MLRKIRSVESPKEFLFHCDVLVSILIFHHTKTFIRTPLSQFTGDVGLDSCIGLGSCQNTSGDIGDESCEGANSCQGSTGNIANNSCRGEEACVGNTGKIAPNSCNGDGACFRNNAGERYSYHAASWNL